MTPEQRRAHEALTLIESLGEEARNEPKARTQLEFFQSQQIVRAMKNGATSHEIVSAIRRGAGLTD